MNSRRNPVLSDMQKITPRPVLLPRQRTNPLSY
jgi:hypothetical protein